MFHAHHDLLPSHYSNIAQAVELSPKGALIGSHSHIGMKYFRSGYSASNRHLLRRIRPHQHYRLSLRLLLHDLVHEGGSKDDLAGAVRHGDGDCFLAGDEDVVLTMRWLSVG